MTEEQLRDIEARAAAATPGPWAGVPDTLGHWHVVWPHGHYSSVARNGKFFSDEDAAFVTCARTDVPALVAEVRRLQAQVPS